MRFFRNLKWLIKHKDDIEKLLKNKDNKTDKRYAVGNVPQEQLDYVNNVLNEKNK